MTSRRCEAINDGLYQALIRRISQSEREGFSVGQLRALEAACQDVAWGRHPVDIRLSIPVLFSRVYLVFLMGKERRSARRRAEERRRHPLNTLLNYLFVGVLIAVGIYGIFFLQTLIFMVYYSEPLN